ncbi:MAG: T9SS type A sorting domain-containing protein, partial [Bacteroidetes bacterium]|nr:T9SS type A sorting domain-containing protein [Bacteroidota bacterium]
YFLPGSPQEGWSIQIDSLRADAWNQMGCGGSLMDPGLTGRNISDTTIDSVRRAIWRGMFDSVEITQVTTLDTTSMFFTVHVIFKNRSHTVRNNVYYLRTVDPDNDEPESSSFITKNKIEYQLPNLLNAVLISATGSTGAWLGLGTRDSIAKCFIIKSGLAPNKGVGANGLDSMFGRFGGIGDTTAYQYQDSNTADQGIGLVFKISTLNPVPTDSVIISYAYIFSGARGDVDAALSSTVAPWSLDTTHTNTEVNNVSTAGGTVKVYPNPFKDEIAITGASLGGHVVLYDNMGRRVQQIFNIENDKSANIFHLANLPTGLYIMVVTDKNGNIVSKTPLQKQ